MVPNLEMLGICNSMKIKFWGVRGSIPTPLTPDQLKNKVSAIINRVRNRDIKEAKTKELFLAKLPDYIFGTIGGNTTCIELITNYKNCIIFDAGSGIRELGSYLKRVNSTTKYYHIFFTHFHWDHIQGLPFFYPAFKKENTIFFYSPIKEIKEFIREQMKYPYFPVNMNVMKATLRFFKLEGNKMKIGNIEIEWKRMKHPGGSFCYKMHQDGKSIILATDTEITEKDFEKTKKNIDFFQEVDILILDSQYTLEEAFDKPDWGHTSPSMAVDFAANWQIKKLVLFHHEPGYNDWKIYRMLRATKWYVNHLDIQNKPEISLAVEGMELAV